MSYEEQFARAESSGEEGVFTRIDESHPLGIFLGLESGQRAVMVICSKRPPDPPSLAAIRVEARPRHDDKWALMLRLARPELKGLFTRLVEDLDGATRQLPEDPGKVVVERLARWQRLFSRAAPGMLEDQELRGLAAELDFLLVEAVPAVGPRAAVAAWTGPYDAPKDFVFDRAEVEVKAVHRNHRTITITSLEQLSDAGLPLFLWSRVVTLDEGSHDEADSFASLIGRARATVAHEAGAAERFELGLQATGYEDRPEYLTRTVRFGPATCFHVAEGFPRLQRKGVPAEIVACTYEVSVAVLDQFRVKTWNETSSDGQ